MEKVHGLIAYHISVSKRFEAGDVLRCGRRKNGVYRKYLLSVLNPFKSAKDRMRIKIQRGLERVRKKYYRDLPSRFKVLFVFPERADCEELLRRWRERGKRPGQLLVLRLDGFLHRCAHQNPSDSALSDGEIMRGLHDYWRGIGGTDEYLFAGTAIVVEAEELL